MGFMAPSGREPSVALDGMMLLGVMARPRSFIYEERPQASIVTVVNVPSAQKVGCRGRTRYKVQVIRTAECVRVRP